MKKVPHLLLAALLLFPLCSSWHRTPRFEDMYECYIIIDVEVSDYDEDEFDQVDCEEFMSIIARAKLSNLAFEPAKKVNLYDDDGIRYNIFNSRSGSLLRIDSNYFQLNRRQAKRLQRLIGG